MTEAKVRVREFDKIEFHPIRFQPIGAKVSTKRSMQLDVRAIEEEEERMISTRGRHLIEEEEEGRCQGSLIMKKPKIWGRS